MHEASAEQASRTVIAFLEAVAAGDVDAAFSAHVADDFHHHNPWFADDRAAMCEAMKASAAAEPGKRSEVQKVITEGDRVVVFSRPARPQGRLRLGAHRATA